MTTPNRGGWCPPQKEWRRRIPTLSLFSGAGGLDLGFHAAGFEVTAAVEIEEDYCASLRANVGIGKWYGPNMEIHCIDVQEFARQVAAGKYNDAGIECIIGGPPCQTFSAASRRSGGVLGTSDERGQLFMAYCNILASLRPQAFVFENVYGLPGANGGRPWRQIVETFSRIGYTLRSEVVDAADYGVAQHRERLLMVGSLDAEFVFPKPTHGPDSGTDTPLVSSLDAIRDLQDPDEPSYDNLGGRYGHLLPLVPPGLNYSFFTKEMGHPEPVFAWRSKFHDLLYKVDPSNPVRTIKARPGKFTGPFHWKNRHFTADELRRLQSFPDSYRLVGAYNKVVEQIGNSVPPRLAYVMAVSVREQLLEHGTTLTYQRRPPIFRSTFRIRQRERNRLFHVIAQKAIEAEYPSLTSKAEQRGPSKERHLIRATGFFDRKRVRGLDGPASGDGDIFGVEVTRVGRHLALGFEQMDVHESARSKLTIEITGLRKYLGGIDSLTARASIAELAGLFHVWASIEEALISRSRFFTLIDIYGHYANRGDTVRIRTEFEKAALNTIEKAILLFSQSENCGEIAKRLYLENQLGVDAVGVMRVVDAMRMIRYDIRTRKTHPTLAAGEIICTYPFPLLSEKAHKERRIDQLALVPSEGASVALADSITGL